MRLSNFVFTATMASLLSCAPYDDEPYDEEQGKAATQTEATSDDHIEGKTQALAPRYAFINTLSQLCMEVQPFDGALASMKPCTLGSKQNFVAVFLRSSNVPGKARYALRHVASNLCLVLRFNTTLWRNEPGLGRCGDNTEWLLDLDASGVTRLVHQPSGRCAIPDPFNPPSIKIGYCQVQDASDYWYPYF